MLSFKCLDEQTTKEVVISWMDLEFITLSEESHTKKDKYHMISLICRILKKMIQMNLQNRNRLTNVEDKFMVTKGDRGGRDKLGVWD